MANLLGSLRALGLARLAAMAGISIAIVGLLGWMALRADVRGPYAPLFRHLGGKDAGDIVDQLGKAHIPYELGDGGAEISVPAPDVPQARLLLAKQNLPTGGAVGYEIFDGSNGLTASGFRNRIDETRALEGELTRSIDMIDGVRAARVQLVLPERQPFAQTETHAQASVLLTMQGSARLDSEGVQAIVNLVSAAVPELKPDQIAIVDSRGEILARAGTPGADASGVATVQQLRQAMQLQIDRAVEQVLEPSLGVGHVRAQAAVELNFDKVQETHESYDPNQQVLRSQQTSSDKSSRTDAATSVSVQNNLPNANAGKPKSGTQDDRQQETDNYEIGKTVRVLTHDRPELTRLSLAVLVDDAESWKNGKPVYTPRSPEELARIKTLVENAVGYDAKRGDTVDVVDMRFADDTPVETVAQPHGMMAQLLAKYDPAGLAEVGVIGLVALVAVLFVFRPMALRLSLAASGGGTVAAPGRPEPGTPARLRDAGAPSEASARLMIRDESMVNLANVEGQLRASSLHNVAALVERHPDESLSIFRGWMTQEAG